LDFLDDARLDEALQVLADRRSTPPLVEVVQLAGSMAESARQKTTDSPQLRVGDTD
jgi:hypothetical protein